MAIITKLDPPPAPNLPIAPNEYKSEHFDVFNNVLRLYFNRLFEALKGVLGSNGGKYIQFPHIAASYSDDQYATANNTPTIVQWDTLDAGNGFTLNVDNTATAQFPGIYKITYSIQFINDDNVIHNATVWLRINGVTPAADVINSATIFSVPARKSAGVPSYVCGYSEVVFQLTAGDKVGLWWGTDQAATSSGTLGVSMWHQPIETTPMNHPAVPSVIGSITFVSAPN
jgi:hypothetical protein